MIDYRDTAQAAPATATGEQLHTLSARMVVPLSVSLVSGMFIFILALLILAKFISVSDAAWVGALLAVIVAVGVWAWLQWRLEIKLDRMIGVLELAVGRNLDPDPRIGNGLAPEPKTIKRRLEVDVTEGNVTQRARYEDEDLVIRVAREIESGKPFSAALVERHILTRGQWEDMRDELLLHGHIIQRDEDDEKRGYEITRAGRAFFRYMAAQETHSPTE